MQTETLAGNSILIVEDEPLLRKQLAAWLERMGMDVTQAGDLASARRLASSLGFDFALLDVNLPDGRGLDLLTEKAFPPETGVVVMTAEGGVSGAVESMRLGALDYLLKPVEPAALPLVLQRAKRARREARATEHRRGGEAAEEFVFTPALADLEVHLKKILAADERMTTNLPPVLIVGETGTGKTSLARWLHRNGPRSGQPILEVNCSALPETLAESELFGHERGAFTDARSSRMGLFEAASGGTLFLDELPSLSLPLQAKLLKTIEDRHVRRVGANRPVGVDTRLIAATNRDLGTAISAGEFREDLFHRLDLYRIRIPPLRERREDILPLASKLMARLCHRHRLPQKQIVSEGRSRLESYSWPGNVRELAHELERAIVFEEGHQLDFAQLTSRMGPTPSVDVPEDEWFNGRFRFPEQGFMLEEAINRLIHHALTQTRQNVSAAARLLGVSRDYVRYRLEGGKTSKTPDGDQSP